jgi:hypothetical protein
MAQGRMVAWEIMKASELETVAVTVSDQEMTVTLEVRAIVE